ncbi:MAG: hypothetical protein V1754_09170 [Pseudomonadota bacterium]
MNPIDICKQKLGLGKINQILEELSSLHVKTVLKQGGLKVKLPGGFVSQQRRRELWSRKIIGAIEQNNEDTARELLQQWLLHRRRAVLIRYLDLLEVKHRDGETDDSFLLSKPAEKIRDCAKRLMGEFDSIEVAAYLLYIAHQQRASVFDDWEPLYEQTKAQADAD